MAAPTESSVRRWEHDSAVVPAISHHFIAREYEATRPGGVAHIRKLIERRELTQAAAAKLFGVTQPRISDLVRGRIDLFSLDMLVNMLAAAGVQVRLVLKRSSQVA